MFKEYRLINLSFSLERASMNLYLEAAVNNFPNCLILRGAKNSGTCLNYVLITFVKYSPTLHKEKQEFRERCVLRKSGDT